MKKSVFTLVIIMICSFKISSQINVSRLNEKDIEVFKKSTTYFIIPTFDSNKKQQYIDALKNCWTVTPIKIVTEAEAEKINMKDPSISKFDAHGTQVTTEYGGLIYYYQLFLNMHYLNKKGEVIEKQISFINFCLQTKGVENLYDKKGDKKEQAAYLDKNNITYNFSLGFIKNYLQCVNSNFTNNLGQRLNLSKEVIKEEIQALTTKDTIFIPDYVSEFPESNVEEALAKAKFKYKIIPVKELDSKILTCNKSFYYLNFVRHGEYKSLNIINAQSGSFIFSNFNPVGLKLKNLTLLDDDIKIINSALK